MNDKEKLILAINPGSTSMKMALFSGKECIALKDMKINILDLLENYTEMTPYEESPFTKVVEDFMDEEKTDFSALDIIVARGGPHPYLPAGGAYGVNDLLVYTLKYAPLTKHGAQVGPEVAKFFADKYGIPAIMYDSPCTDEADEIAHITGLPGIKRDAPCHLLNTRMRCRQVAESIGRTYEDTNWLVAHLGGGVSISAHLKGRVADTAFSEEGPIAPTRSGTLPIRAFSALCYSGKYTRAQIVEMTMSRGGLQAYFGTSDGRELEKMIARGNSQVETVYDAMIYTIAKHIGMIAVTLKGDIDGVILTGGLAYSERVVSKLKEYISFLGPVYVLPGENEMKALALGALRVLEESEDIKEYKNIPEGYSSIEEFAEKYNMPAG